MMKAFLEEAQRMGLPSRKSHTAVLVVLASSDYLNSVPWRSKGLVPPWDEAKLARENPIPRVSVRVWLQIWIFKELYIQYIQFCKSYLTASMTEGFTSLQSEKQLKWISAGLL